MSSQIIVLILAGDQLLTNIFYSSSKLNWIETPDSYYLPELFQNRVDSFICQREGPVET